MKTPNQYINCSDQTTKILNRLQIDSIDYDMIYKYRSAHQERSSVVRYAASDMDNR